MFIVCGEELCERIFSNDLIKTIVKRWEQEKVRQVIYIVNSENEVPEGYYKCGFPEGDFYIPDNMYRVAAYQVYVIKRDEQTTVKSVIAAISYACTTTMLRPVPLHVIAGELYHGIKTLEESGVIHFGETR